MNEAAKRPLLILDLDETLVYGSEVVLHRPADFRVGQFHVYRRPGLAEFLRSTSAHYDLAVWSSASDGYVAAVARTIATEGIHWQFVWSRLRCVERKQLELQTTQRIKDLRKVKRLGYDLRRTLICDDTHHKVARHYGNAVYVEPYEGAEDDTELTLLAEYLNSLRNEPNFRQIEKRGWRRKLLTD